jgi:O-antigen/teichoic acid export membrane protein
MIKRSIVNSAVYSFISLLQPLVNLALLPLITSSFSIADYGLFSILINLGVLINVFAACNISTALIPFYSTITPITTKEEYSKNFFSFSILSNILLAPFIIIIILWFGNYYNLSLSLATVTPTVLLFIVSNLFSSATTMLRIDNYTKEFIYHNIVQLILLVLLQVIVLTFSSLSSIINLLYARLFALLCSVIIILYTKFTISHWVLKDVLLLKKSIQYGLALIPTSLINWLATYNDRLIISKLLDKATLGKYSLIMNLSSILDVIIISIGSSIQVNIFNSFKNLEYSIINLYLKRYLGAIVLIESFACFCSSFLKFYIKSPAYADSIYYFPLVLSAFFYSGLFFFFNLQTLYSKKASPFLFISMMNLLLSLTLNNTLIPRLGIDGAIQTFFIVKFLVSIFAYFIAQGKVHVKYSFSKIYLLFICDILIAFGYFLPQRFSFLAFWNTTQFIACYFIVLLIDTDNKSYLKDILRNLNFKHIPTFWKKI